MEEIISLADEVPTAFHYVALARKLLTESGFAELKEEDNFTEIPEKFFVCRDEQTVLAFNILDTKCGKFLATSLDYPTLKIQPNSGRFHHNCEQVNSYLYGKGMWFTWPDKDLTLAGRVFIREKSGNDIHIVQKLIYPKIPMAEIPNLASHLNPGRGTKADIKLEHLQPVLNFLEKEEDNENQQKHSPTLMKIIANECKCEIDDIENFDLSFISAEDQKIIGLNDELLSSQRISSILTSIIALKEFINQYGGDNKPYRGLACFYAYSNDQEIYSSRTGSNSNFLESILKRIGVKFVNNKDNFFSSSSFYGIKNTSGNLNHGIRTFSDQQGKYHFTYEFSETTLNTLEKNKINVTRINSSNLTVDGAASIGKKFNFPTFVFGIPIGGFFSIRETAFLNDLKVLKEVIEILLK